MFVDDSIRLNNGELLFIPSAEIERVRRKITKQAPKEMPACWRRFLRATSGPVLKVTRKPPQVVPTPEAVEEKRPPIVLAPIPPRKRGPRTPRDAKRDNSWMERSRFAA